MAALALLRLLDECDQVRHFLRRHALFEPFRHQRQPGTGQRFDAAARNALLDRVRLHDRDRRGVFVAAADLSVNAARSDGAAIEIEVEVGGAGVAGVPLGDFAEFCG